MTLSRKDIHFILVRTRFASNLGSSVRAMKNMGFDNLILVEPECEVGVEARAFAMGGAAILDSAVFMPGLEAAAGRVNVLVGTTGRFRQARPSLVDCRDFAQHLAANFGSSSLGLVFGSEENGLSHEELALCQWLMRIPAGSDYPVMNLAQAVAVVAYEFNLALQRPCESGLLHEATAGENDGFLAFLEAQLRSANLPEGVDVDRAMHRLRRIAARARLEKEDINLLRQLLRNLLQTFN